MDYATTTVPAPSASIRVRTAGSGPALVLLPGLGRPAGDLDPMARLLVAAGYRIIQPDPRGSGGSTGPLDGLTLHDLAGDVAAVIESAGEAGITIVGHAFGNRIARAVAANRPDLVRMVVLLGCSGKVQPSPEIAEAIRLAQAVDTDPATRARAVADAWFAPGRDTRIWMDGWSQQVMNAYLAAAAATDTASWWTAGRARVLIIQGLADVSAPPGNGRLLKQEIGNRAALIELPGIGHALAVEDPGTVAAIIVAHLGPQDVDRA
jgi:pimeloyl-ACP methyl ester carboxylesterase